MSAPRVLVSGASVAGPAAAWWLARAGWSVTVVERSSGLRVSGQNVDIRATGRDVVALMGLEDEVRARSTGEVGTRFVDEQGRPTGEFGVQEGAGDGPTAELEILRGDLAELLVDACPDHVTWWFNDHVTAVEQRPGEVEVTLAGGRTEVFDLLVVADGVRSTTRELVLPDGVEVRPLGMSMAFGTIERTPADDDWWRWLNVSGSRQAQLRPDNHGTIRASLVYLADPDTDGLVGLDPAGQRRALRERFGDVGWEVPRILDGFDATDDLYVDDLAQVRCEAWHRGRVVLLGDAGWCVTPVGGGGSSLALVGAHVLAACLSQVGDPGAAGSDGAVTDALAAYEEWMRPVVADVQDLPPGVPRLAAPRTRVGVGALRLATRIAASGPVQAVATRLTSGPESGRELPPFCYPAE